MSSTTTVSPRVALAIVERVAATASAASRGLTALMPPAAHVGSTG
ncbi:MAG: hypothetical protein M5U27_09960 [Gaiella sp.]|nr:hypothetical protein [Gaiella sp.]